MEGQVEVVHGLGSWPPLLLAADPALRPLVPSVTTILSNLSKPALVNWSAREVATFAVTFHDQWVDLPDEAAIDMLKRAPYRNMSRKGEIGSAVHAAIDAWHGGWPEGQDPYVRFLQAIEKARADAIKHSSASLALGRRPGTDLLVG